MEETSPETGTMQEEHQSLLGTCLLATDLRNWESKLHNL